MEKDELAEMVNKLTPETVNNLRQMIAVGKKPDGRKLSTDERESCIQAVLWWEAKYLPEEQRTGYIEQSCKKKDSNPSDPVKLPD